MRTSTKYFIFVPIATACKAIAKFPYKDIIEKVLGKFLIFTIYFAGGVILEIQGTFLMKYVSSKFSSKVYLPLDLIREAIADGWLDSLCYYVWIKKLHHRPVIYNYSLRKISAGINCSPTTVKTHLSVLKQHGLCVISAGNLMLKSTNEFFRQKQLMVPVGISNNKTTQISFLRFAVIKRKFHSQTRQYNIKSNTLKYYRGINADYNDIKSGIRLSKLFPNPVALENSMQDVLTLSNRKFGSLCNRSQSTGLKIQKALNDLNLITSHKRVSLVTPLKQNRREFFRLDLGSNHFLSKKGQVFKRLTNRIELVKVI